MEALNGILLITLIAAIAWEVRGYNKFVTAGKQLTVLAETVQAAFEGVVKDVGEVNQELAIANIRADTNDEAIDILNKNDALIELYLNIFRDALGIEADKLSRIGTLKHPEANSQKN